VAELATAQRGLVTRRQLRVIGLSRHAIDHRLKAARLHPLYRGVYLVGHSIPAPGARELGAALACGPGTVVSHRAAGGLWRLVHGHASRAAFEHDRLRDAQLAAMGFRVIRVTWRQLMDGPEGVMTRIAVALGR